MRTGDVVGVMRLQHACGLNPGSEASLLSELESDVTILLVAARSEGGQDFIGGVFAARVVLDELQIDNLAVLPALRGYGIGAMLLRTALDLAVRKGAIRGVLEVRANNGVAQNLYRKFGFEVVGRRLNYYQQPIEDALVMVRDLAGGLRAPGSGRDA